MNAEWNFLSVVAVFVNKIEPARLGEIDLVGGDRKLASDCAPGLHIDLRPVKRGFIRHFDIIDSGIFEHAPRHLLCLYPELWFIDKLCIDSADAVRHVLGETHQIFLDPEEL